MTQIPQLQQPKAYTPDAKPEALVTASDTTPAAATPAPDTTPAPPKKAKDGPILPELQSWVADDSGRKFPLVGDSYLDVQTGKIEHGYKGMTFTGPPTLDIYWINRGDTTVEDPWPGCSTVSTLSMTEYIARMGALLNDEDCNGRLHSLNATEFSITVVIYINISRKDMRLLRRKHGI